MPENNLNTQLLNTVSKNKWERIGLARRSGVVVPLFSVYSRDSIGIGDFEDLKLVVDWCDKTGNTILQFLPLNEMGSLLCPYDAISSCALEPLYISLKAIASQNKNIIKKLGTLKENFPVGRPYLDYRLKQEKMRLLWEAFLEESPHDNREFNDFIAQNNYWIYDYALFQVMKYHREGRPWYEWEDEYKDRKGPAIELFQKEHEEEIMFYIWIQWLAFAQFKQAKSYAKEKKILFKGDLPILISRDSADVWAHPEFFKLEYASGAPPDMYCAKGQRWGMPTYNWENIASDEYRYLKEKLKYAQNFYDILRIDHVVGLFRIWSIPYNDPLENQGLNGIFDPKEQSKWKEHGETLLSVMLDSASMLLCAEDLGTIPPVCTDTLKELSIPGNDVQRWVKEWKVKHDFLLPSEYRFLSVAMLSTHDTTNWPAWWENEAGTIDEALFIKKCAERKIDYNLVKDKLFNFIRSRHGRLRWLDSVNSTDLFVGILGKRKEELADFIDMYENSFQEKKKLWKHLKIKGPMREKSDAGIVKEALRISLESSAVFCINTLIDWLYFTGIFKGDAYQYRTNTPGTISDKNWSLTIPISLEALLKHKVNKDIRAMIAAAQRI